MQILISRIERIWEDDEAENIIRRVNEIQLSREDERNLATTLKKLANEGETLPYKLKTKVDRALARLTKCLSPEYACDVAGQFFDHPRKARRDIACRIFSKVDLDDQLAKKLLGLFAERKEEELLHLIARSSQIIHKLDVETLLSNISDEYWRARVIQALLENDRKKATDLSSQYPFEFVHAVGRIKDKGSLEILKELFRKNRNGFEFLGIYVWCLGILGAQQQLIEVEKILDLHIKEFATGVAADGGAEA